MASRFACGTARQSSPPGLSADKRAGLPLGPHAVHTNPLCVVSGLSRQPLFSYSRVFVRRGAIGGSAGAALWYVNPDALRLGSEVAIMKPNFIVPEHTFREEEIANQNSDIEPLYQALLPDAKSLIRNVVLPRMAAASEKMSCPDFLGLIDQIPDAELNYATSNGQCPGKFRATLKELLASDSSLEDDDEWFQSRAEDLALTVALFWLELGTDTQERVKSGKILLQESHMRQPRNHPASSNLCDFRLIAARFYLDNEAFGLLDRLNELGSAKSSLPFHIPKG
jgi:hypothetical protein